MHPLFTHEWALALGAALESSATYREAARRWDGAVCLQRTADTSTTLASVAVFLDLKHGHCHAARLATEADLKQAKFVISGPLTAWLSVLRGHEAPTVALMRGHLTLAKGMLPMLLPHVGAANALVDVVRAVSPLTDHGAPGVRNTPDHTAVPTNGSAQRPGFRSLERGAFTDDSVPWRLWEKPSDMASGIQPTSTSPSMHSSGARWRPTNRTCCSVSPRCFRAAKRPW